MFNVIIFGLNHVKLKSGQIVFLVQKDARCTEIYEKSILQFVGFLFLRNGQFFKLTEINDQ